MDPPQCVQNAMMTKDKKPFTYTPGGIDLSEVRSPRMQRRIERNANLGGVGDFPKAQPPPPQNVGPLPPSVQAVMRPQPQVQVFPSGPPPPPPMARGGVPPPPPFNAPPPPPPPSGPLPTQKVTTSDNQVLERPDMTKIIPDNPMALLRKTGGPAPRRSIVDEMFAQEGKAAPTAITPPSGQQRAPPQFEQQQRYQQPTIERGAPVSPVPQQYQPPKQQYQPPQPQQQYQAPPPQQQYQPPPPQQQYQSPLPQQRSPETANEPPKYQPPVIERQPTISRQNNGQPETKTSNAHLGSLYIPPINQQQTQPQKRIVSPPSPPERNTDSPGLQTPPLREAPRPWQAKKVQQEEIPPWAKKNEQDRPDFQNAQQTQSPPTQQQQPQQRWPQSRPVQQQQPAQQYNNQPQYNQQPQPTQQFNQQPQQIQQPAGVPVRIIIRTNTGPGPYQQPPQELQTKPEAVYITQPVVLQHPGPRAPPQQQQQPKRELIAPPYKPEGVHQGARVIPTAVEGANQGPQTPTTLGNNKSLNRQQSWSNNPTQSNTFKIIQKITQTDDDEEDENVPITEHGPTYPQNFQQLPADQLRRMKLNEGDQSLMNKFKQDIHYYDEENPRYRGGHIPSKVFRILDESVVDDDNSQREVDPRYRGPAIPSKAFKLLQNMTEGSVDPSQYHNKSVPSGPQPQKKGPQVRTIPIQIENDSSPQPYVHPSEQVVPEPKKYTGSSIPSRSFKILQAMTAPDNCANVDEQYEATPYDQWGYDPNYPPYPPPPYWQDYYNYYYQEPQPGLSKDESSGTSGRTTPRQTPTPRHTPVPYWNYMPPYPYPPSRRASTAEPESDAETCTNPRSTPLPFWGDEAQCYPQYPPYYDPYYYSYYYGYPPMYPPYAYYSDTDDFAGYSSTDEMAYYNNPKNRRRNSFSGRRSTTPRIVVTPTLNVKETVVNKKMEKIEKQEQEPEMEINTSESDSDTETEEDNNRNQTSNNPLRSIRSVNNIQLYAEHEDNDSHCSDDEVDIQEYNEDENEEIDEENSVYLVDDDSYPHQLSVIYEESERTDSRMRSASALSDSTTIAEKSDDEDLSPNVNMNTPFKFCVSVTEDEKKEIKAVVNIGDREIKTFGDSLNNQQIPIEELIDSDEDNEDDIEEVDVYDDEEGKDSDESEDWWGIIGKEDDLPAPKPIILKNKNRPNEEDSNTEQYVENTNKSKKTISGAEGKEKAIDVCPKREETVNRCTKAENTKSVSNNKKEAAIVEKVEEATKSKNNFARAKSVYDKIEDEFEEEQSTGKLIEMESFVEQLEQMQKASGLWNIQLPRKVRDNNKLTATNANDNKESVEKKSRVGENETKTSNTFKINSSTNFKNKEGDVDFWSTIKKEEDEIPQRSKTQSKHNSADYKNYNDSKSWSAESKGTASLSQDILSTETSVEYSYENSPESSKSCEENAANKEIAESDDSSLESSEDECDEHDQKEDNDENNNEEQEVQPMSIQERIQALKEAIKQKQNKLQQQEQEMKVSVKEKVSAIETTQNRSKTTSTKSSIKSFEEYSEEEEGDSGVTSDMSRHISDTEEFPELKKLTRYQRAATHSRLFKLLQDECENEEDEDEDDTAPESANNLSVKGNNAAMAESPRRDQLSLPLKTNETESLCSSGVTSPGSPVNDKLVNELVQSLLKRKKGQIFRNMPKEKLFAAAARILQEDLENLDASSEDCSSFLSPLRGSTGSSTAAQTPQEFNGNYDEYKQYYESWSEAEKLYDENYDILPSKAFKLLQEHSNLSKTGTIAGLLAKCPRVLSSKNIHKKLAKLLESPDSPSPAPENPLESNEVTSAS